MYTQPNPPSPKRFCAENPSVAWISSSYVNHDFELLTPPSEGAYTKPLPEPLTTRGAGPAGEWGLRNSESDEHIRVC